MEPLLAPRLACRLLPAGDLPEPHDARMPDHAMTASRQQAEHGAQALGLVLPPDRLERVAAQLELLSRHVAAVLAVELPPELEPAPVFTP